MNILNHVAFIMDGNGRWGKKKQKNRNYGHAKGVEVVRKIVDKSIKLKIPFLTFYVFSTENWKRPKKEINFLFKLIGNYFSKEIKNINNLGVRINILGEMKNLPLDIKKIFNQVINKTSSNNKINVNLAVNYGSKKEIIQAIKKNKKKINIKNLEKNLYTKNMPDPDILIRTGGYMRLSNFMLWQIAYTEIFFIKKLWPDFKSTDLIKIINRYKNIKRNYGKI